MVITRASPIRPRSIPSNVRGIPRITTCEGSTVMNNKCKDEVTIAGYTTTGDSSGCEKQGDMKFKMKEENKMTKTTTTRPACHHT